MQILKVIIEKIVFGGQAMARHDGRVYFIWGALPGEEVEIEVYKNKKTYSEARLLNVLKPSPDRVEHVEKHYLSCSPWQTMSYNLELEWKRRLYQDVFNFVDSELINNIEIESDINSQYGYRNKIEYSFVEDSDIFYPAFFMRGTKAKHKINYCKLASSAINETATGIVDWINQEDLILRNLKSAIIRSNLEGQTIAAMFIQDEINDLKLPELPDFNCGWQLYFSTHKIRSAVPTSLLAQSGKNYITEKINNVVLKYGLLSFFQINTPLFIKTVNDIANHLDDNAKVVDFFSGVGSIGLPLHKKCSQVELVDNNEEAIAYAQDNINDNGISNAKAFCQLAEQALNLITADKTLILDPPRPGVHPKIIKKIIEEKPKKIIYLSCNLSTQARDLDRLMGCYEIDFVKLYNYFPKTPHIESLIILRL